MVLGLIVLERSEDRGFNLKVLGCEPTTVTLVPWFRLEDLSQVFKKGVFFFNAI